MALSSPDYCLWGYLKEKSYHYTSAHNLQAGFVQPGNYRKSLYDFFKVLETNACHIEHAVVCACVCMCLRPLCNDAVNIWDCRAEWTVDWWMINRRELRRKISWLFVVLLYLCVCLEELRKNTEILCQDIRCLGWNSVPASPESYHCVSAFTITCCGAQNYLRACVKGLHKSRVKCYSTNGRVIKDTFLHNKTNQMHQFPKFTPTSNSTCFGQFLCPSSGVYSLYTRHWYMSYRFDRTRMLNLPETRLTTQRWQSGRSVGLALIVKAEKDTIYYAVNSIPPSFFASQIPSLIRGRACILPAYRHI